MQGQLQPGIGIRIHVKSGYHLQGFGEFGASLRGEGAPPPPDTVTCPRYHPIRVWKSKPLEYPSLERPDYTIAPTNANFDHLNKGAFYTRLPCNCDISFFDEG